ncbi:MAG TPA: SRPBCC family protein [Candidatus Limnocylindrales bacterium]
MEGRAIIDCPAEDLFAFVADAENNPRWHDHVHETRWLDDRATGLGRRGRQTGRLFRREWAFVAEIVEWDPPRLVTFQVIEGYRVRTSLRVEPAGAGSQLTLTVTTPAILGRRIDGFLSRVLARTVAGRGRSDIRRLKRHLEGRAGGG